MNHLLRKLSLAALPICCSLPAHAADVKGVLMDKMCSYKAETRIVPGPRLEGGIVVAYTHTRQCALMPECQKSGYGVFTYDQKFLTFDDNGNRLASAALKATKKEDDLRIEVTGEIQNDTIKVTGIKWLE